MLNGDTKIIAHLGYPTTTFKSPMIYNPWFDARGINAAVVPLGVKSEDFGRAFPEICRFTNFHGALITMPHKVSVIDFIDEVSTAVKVAGSCNAVRRNSDGRLIGDMFDGAGFVRGVARHGGSLRGKRLLVVGAGGVGSAIAASCARAGVGAVTRWRAGGAGAATGAGNAAVVVSLAAAVAAWGGGVFGHVLGSRPPPCGRAAGIFEGDREHQGRGA